MQVSQTLSITLEIVPEDERDLDPAVLSELARSTLNALQQNRYIVKPIHTGQHGG